VGPGHPPPREADLAKELGLSRNSLREAVRALALARVLEVRQGDGTFVSSLEPSELLEPTLLATHLLRAAHGARAVRGAAAARAGGGGDRRRARRPGVIDALGRELERMREAGDSVEGLVEADAPFTT
jgi:GntR family transcriptional repressor for pyruvate dehydrogenase complex